MLTWPQNAKELNFKNFLAEDALEPCTTSHLWRSLSQTAFSKILYLGVVLMYCQILRTDVF